MGLVVIRQPNGNYAIWSSIVDAITVWNASPEEIEQEFIEPAVEQAKEQAQRCLRQADGEPGVRRPFHDLTWEEAVASSNKNYPDSPIPLSGEDS